MGTETHKSLRQTDPGASTYRETHTQRQRPISRQRHDRDRDIDRDVDIVRQSKCITSYLVLAFRLTCSECSA